MRVAWLQLVALGFAASATTAHAQSLDPTPGTKPPIELDGSIGPGGDVPFDGTTWSIGDELGRYNGSGSSLFHSFGRFDIPSGQVAEFSAAHGSPQRVFARVTWGEPSDIVGTLRSTIPGADFYLINPAGVRFEGGAHLDVQGSFHVTTAGSINFSDGQSFTSSASDAPPLLSIAEPASYGFLPQGGGEIAVAPLTSPLSVPQGETLALIGGDVSVFGGGRFDVLSPGSLFALVAGGPGVVVNSDLASFDPAAISSDVSLGTIVINGARVQTSFPAGSILVRGGAFLAENATIGAIHNGSEPVTFADAIDIAVRGDLSIRSGSSINAGTIGGVRGGDIRLSGDSIAISDNAEILSATTATGTAAPGSDIVIGAHSLSLFGGGRIRSETRGGGDGGAIQIETDLLDASDTGYSTQGTQVSSTSTEVATGDAGQLYITADQISLQDGAQIFSSTSGAGNAGLVSLHADDIDVRGLSLDPTGTLSRSSAIDSRALPGSTGNAGEIQADGSLLGVRIDTTTLTVADAAEVGSATQGLGAAGDVVIDASGSVTLQGGPSGPGQLTSDAIAIETDPNVGDGGNVLIDTGHLALLGGGQITTSTRGTGDAGRVEIHADDIEMRGMTGENQSAVFAQTLGIGIPDAGRAGGVQIAAAGDMEMSDGALISVATRNGSRAGDIHIETGGRLSLDHAAISPRAFEGSFAPSGTIEIVSAGGVFLSNGSAIGSRSFGEGLAGTISIDAGPRFEARDSQVSTESLTTSNGGGGVITINATDEVLLTNSLIDTSVKVGGTKPTGGDGGDIHIDPELVVLNRSAIRADTEDGNGGNIFISAGTFVRSEGSEISATSESGGVNGTIVIESPDSVLNTERAEPAQAYLDAAGLLRTSCGAAGGQVASFVVARVAGLPASPEGPLPAPLWDALPEASAPAAGATPVVGEPDRSLRVAALAGGCEAAREGR